MAQVTLTFDLTPETLEVLKLLVSNVEVKSETSINKEVQSIPAEKTKSKKEKSGAKATETTETSEPIETPKSESPVVSLSDVRAAALKLSKAGKQDTLKEIFAAYGAAKLSDIADEHYADLLARLEAANV